MVLNFILALLPIIWLFIAFLAIKMPGHIGCLIALLITIGEALIFKATGFSTTLVGLTAGEAATATLEGVVTAIWPIAIIIIAAMFTYNLCVATGAMDLIKRMLISVTNDKRVLVLILAWGFGGFMEAVAGFGTAVAIPAAMMVALGFDPLFSAVVCLIANAAPPTFGSIGIPTTTAAGLIGVDSISLAGPAMNMLAIPAFLSPFIIVWLTGKMEKGSRPFRGMVGFTFLAAISYVLPALLVAHFVGAEFVDLVGNTVSLLVMLVVAKMRKPTTDPAYIMVAGSSDPEESANTNSGLAETKASDYVKAWAPYVLMLIFLIVSSKLVPPVNAFLAKFTSKFVIFSGENGATVSLAWIGNGGVMIFLAGIIGGLIQGASFKTMGSTLVKTCKSMWKAIATIIFIIAVAKVMGYSGMTSGIAFLLASLTGSMFPLLAPVVGIIGTFVTGSTTSSGILFSKMQAEVAQQIGADAIQLVAANMAGGAIGKLISPQSIAVAIAAIGLNGADGKIMGRTVKYCILFGAIICVISYLTAVVF